MIKLKLKNSYIKETHCSALLILIRYNKCKRNDNKLISNIEYLLSKNSIQIIIIILRLEYFCCCHILNRSLDNKITFKNEFAYQNLSFAKLRVDIYPFLSKISLLILIRRNNLPQVTTTLS